MSDDAIVILKEDHKKVRSLFAQFQNASENAHVARGRLVEQMIEELTVHTYLENEVMYPEVRRLVPDLEQDVLESYEEHHVADVLCTELATMQPTDERFVAKTTVLIENVSHHMDEEEKDWFPQVRSALGRKQLAEIGIRMRELRKTAPRHPAQPSALKKAADALLS
jgi:hemerythrin-like domain-containing protein